MIEGKHLLVDRRTSEVRVHLLDVARLGAHPRQRLQDEAGAARHDQDEHADGDDRGQDARLALVEEHEDGLPDIDAARVEVCAAAFRALLLAELLGGAAAAPP